jgi:hypothetical protein
MTAERIHACRFSRRALRITDAIFWSLGCGLFISFICIQSKQKNGVCQIYFKLFFFFDTSSKRSISLFVMLLYKKKRAGMKVESINAS